MCIVKNGKRIYWRGAKSLYFLFPLHLSVILRLFLSNGERRKEKRAR